MRCHRLTTEMSIVHGHASSHTTTTKQNAPLLAQMDIRLLDQQSNIVTEVTVFGMQQR